MCAHRDFLVNNINMVTTVIPLLRKSPLLHQYKLNVTSQILFCHSRYTYLVLDKIPYVLAGHSRCRSEDY